MQLSSLKEKETDLTSNVSIALPNFCGKLILRHDRWLHEVGSSCVNLDILASRRKQDFRKCPDTLTPSILGNKVSKWLIF
jgi:hypothetical protein